MARGRMLSKSLSTSQRWGRLLDRLGRPAPGAPLGEFARTLYPLLVAHADDFGRQEGDTFTIKHKIDPTSQRPEEDFEAALQGLHDVGLINRYEADGRCLIQIIDFDPHQVGLHKRTESTYAEPSSGNVPELPGNSSLARARGTEGKGKGTELNRREGKDQPSPRIGRAAPLLAGPNPNMAFTGPRVSVPMKQHLQFVGLRNGNEKELFDWYLTVSNEWAYGARKRDEPGADLFAFWRSRYDEKWPATPRATTTTATAKPRPAWVRSKR